MIKLTREPVRISAPGEFPLPGLAGCTYVVGHDAVLMASAARDLPEFIGVDIEGAGKEGRAKYDVKAVQIGTENRAIVFDPRDEAQFHEVRAVLNDHGHQLVMHNSPFDAPILYQIGLLDLDTVWRVWDTLLWARLAEPDEKMRRDLRNASNRHLGMELSDPLPAILKRLSISLATWYADFDLNTPAYLFMAASDPILTARLRHAARDAALARLTTGHPFSKLGVQGDEAQRLVDQPQLLNRIHLRRQCRGYLADPEFLDTYRESAGRQISEWADELMELGIAPGNANSLTDWLEARDLIPENYPRTPKTRRPSGQADDLATLAHPVAEVFVSHKQAVKTDKDYLSKVVDRMDENGRIHSGVNLLGAATGRMSISGDAPLHQFPPGARGVILADNWEEALRAKSHRFEDDHEVCECRTPKGLVSIDWAQIEPVTVANVAGDHEALIPYETTGAKFYHALIRPGITYDQAKVTLLAQLYGEGLEKLARDLRLADGIDGAKRLRDLVWSALPMTAKYAGRGGKLQTVAKTYQMIITLAGRIVPVPSGLWPCRDCNGTGITDLDDEEPCRWCKGKGMRWSVAVHKGVNYFVQGSAYDLLAEAEISIYEAGLSDAIFLPMHDEIVCDAEAAHDIRRIMETPPPRLIHMAKRVPVLRTDMAHLGERWGYA